MKDEIKKELEETTLDIIKRVKFSAKDLMDCSQMQEVCAGIGILVDTLLRLEEYEAVNGRKAQKTHK